MDAQDIPQPQPIQSLQIETLTKADLMQALQGGWQDLARNLPLSLFFGVIAAGIGLVFLAGLIYFDRLWMVVPAGVGFPLVAPFLAAGLYEMSRRYETNASFKTGDIFGVIFQQQRREFGWMAFVVLFVFWIWIYQIRLLLALFLQWESFSDLGEFMTILTEPNGLAFLAVGSVVGAVIASVLFSITVISMPLLLHREIDFVSAMILSLMSVRKNARMLLIWGLVIAVLTFVALLPALLGLVIVFPLLGHASWHLYRKLITEKPKA